jgi:hypothetical protein
MEIHHGWFSIFSTTAEDVGIHHGWVFFSDFWVKGILGKNGRKGAIGYG